MSCHILSHITSTLSFLSSFLPSFLPYLLTTFLPSFLHLLLRSLSLPSFIPHPLFLFLSDACRLKKVMYQTLKALEFIHGLRLIHCDIKVRYQINPFSATCFIDLFLFFAIFFFLAISIPLQSLLQRQSLNFSSSSVICLKSSHIPDLFLGVKLFYFLLSQPENIVIKSFSRCEIKLIDFGSSCFTTDHLTSYIQSRSYRFVRSVMQCHVMSCNLM